MKEPTREEVKDLMEKAKSTLYVSKEVQIENEVMLKLMKEHGHDNTPDMISSMDIISKSISEGIRALVLNSMLKGTFLATAGKQLEIATKLNPFEIVNKTRKELYDLISELGEKLVEIEDEAEAVEKMKRMAENESNPEESN